MSPVSLVTLSSDTLRDAASSPSNHAASPAAERSEREVARAVGMVAVAGFLFLLVAFNV